MTCRVKHRKTPTSVHVFELAGGNEDNSLFVEPQLDERGNPVWVSVWEPDEQERGLLAEGATIELFAWGLHHQPVAVAVGASMQQRREEAR
jgi:hypothetical protein